MLRAELFVSVVCILFVSTSLVNGAAFLESKLPLKVQLVLPTGLANGSVETVTVTGQQAITVVFSRAVVALGSDYGSGPLPNDKVPLLLSGSVPGKAHWVTSYIYRFDPSVQWPTDLSVQLTWNTNLTSFDGVQVDLEGLSSLRLVSTPLTMQLQDVTSEKASQLSENQWRAVVTPNSLPEVPPDGLIRLVFNYNVSLSLVQDALIVKKGASAVNIQPNVSACPTQSWYEETNQVKPVDTVEEDTCILVSLGGDLEVNTTYSLVLPSGSKYNKVSGLLDKELSAQFTGLREFVIPFKQGDDAADLRYVNLQFIVPHGVAADVSDAELESAITLEYLGPVSTTTERPQTEPSVPSGEDAGYMPDVPADSLESGPSKTTVGVAGRRLLQNEASVDWASYAGTRGTPVAFDLRNVSKGVFNMMVDDIKPAAVYRIVVKGSSSIKDGFGLPLKESSGLFSMSALQSIFAEPQFSGSYDSFSSPQFSSLALIGSDSEWQTKSGTWGAVVRKGVAENGNGDASRLSAWSIPSTTQQEIAQALQLLSGKLYDNSNAATSSSVDLQKLFGKAAATIDMEAGNSAKAEGDTSVFNATQILSSGLLGKQQCCTQWYDGTQRPGETSFLHVTDVSVGLVSVTELQEVVVWVTDLKDGTPVRQAEVTLWNVTQAAPPSVLDNQTTGSEGLVQFSLAKYNPDSSNLVLVVRYGPQLNKMLPVGAVPFQGKGIGEVKGEIVIDKALLRPGEDLYVKGYLTSQNGSNVEVPKEQLKGLDVMVVVDNGFAGSSDGAPVQVAVTVDPDFGTFNVTISVPMSAIPGDDTIKLVLMPQNSSSPAGSGSEGSGRMTDSGGSRTMPVPGGDNPDAETVATATVTVSDPRPPTVEMKLEAPEWAAPDESVPVTVRLQSYIGTQVGGAKLDVSWTLSYKGQTTDGSFPEPVVTDSRGVAKFDIPSQDVNVTADSWDSPSLTVKVQWMGPTRERLVQTSIISLQDAPVKVLLYRSVETHVSKVKFYVAADAAFVKGEKLEGNSVDIKLYLNGTDGEAPVASCTIETGAGYSDACRLAIPDLGVYVLEGCTEYNGTRGCTKDLIGKEEEGWRSEPLHEFPVLNTISTAQEDDSEIGIQLEVPYSNAWALFTWGNGMSVKNKVAQMEAGLQSVKLSRGDECIGGCKVQVLISVPRQQSGFTQAVHTMRGLPGILVSSVFDSSSPQMIQLGPEVIDAPLNITQAVDVSVSANSSADASTRSVDATGSFFQPGDAVSIAVSLPNASSRGLDGTAEVTVVVVDKSILDLKSVQDPALAEDLSPSYPVDFTTSRTVDRIIQNTDAIDKSLAHALSQLAVDPWLVPEWGDMNLQYPTGLDVELDTALEQHHSFLTYGDENYYGVASEMDAAEMASGDFANDMMMVGPPSSQGSGPQAGRAGPPTSSSSSSSASAPRLTSDFVSTPLFTSLTTPWTQTATVSLTAPMKLGTYVVRTFVRTSDGFFGQTTSELVVRSPVSLVPSVPRFARVRDSFDAGVVVTSVGAKDEVTITVTAQLPSENATAVQLQGNSSQTVSVKPNGSAEVRFSFAAGALGEGDVLFSATSSLNDKDALQVALGVQGVQDSVFMASSFAISGSNTSSSSQWTEGMQLPDAVPGSGTLNISAGVGRLPAVVSVSGKVVEGTPRDTADVSADWALAAVVSPAVLKQYGVAANAQESSGVNDAAELGVQQLSSGLTNDNLGLMWSTWFAGGGYSGMMADVRLNAWGKWLVDTAAGLSQNRLLKDEAEKWGTVAARAIGTEAAQARAARGQYNDLDTLATVYLALGADWKPEASDPQVTQDLSLSRLITEMSNLTVYAQSALVITLSKQSGQEATINKAVDLLLDGVRIRGSSAYIASGVGSNAAADGVSQALALLAFLATKSPVPVVTEKLANYVANQFSGAAVPTSYSAAATSMIALGAYDQSRGSTSPDLEVTVSAGSTTLLKETFNDASEDVVRTSVAWSELPATNASLTFSAAGEGEASISVGLDFVPAELNTSPLYRGIQVERVIQRVNRTSEEAVGPALQGVPLSSQVRITIRVTTPDTLGPVTVRVLMPGGLEPVDPNVLDESGATIKCPLYPVMADFRSMSSMYLPWVMCPQLLVWPSVVEVRYPSMPAGTYESSFLAIAATVGDWQLPPTKAFAALEPEVMGLSGAGNFTVCDDCKDIEAQPPTAAKSCPNDCSGSGLCDSERGVCLCLEGYSGADCSTADGVEVYRQR